MAQTPSPLNRRIRCEFNGCNKTFGKTNSLNQHIARVHEKKLFECQFCHDLLSSGFRLKCHVTRFHSADLNETKIALVVETNDGIKIAPEAKPALLKAQKEKIIRLQQKLSTAKALKEEFQKQIALERECQFNAVNNQTSGSSMATQLNETQNALVAETDDGIQIEPEAKPALSKAPKENIKQLQKKLSTAMALKDDCQKQIAFEREAQSIGESGIKVRIHYTS